MKTLNEVAAVQFQHIRTGERLTLSVAECAELLGVSRTLLYQETSAGRIPHTRVGGRILFHRPTIEQWLAKGG